MTTHAPLDDRIVKKNNTTFPNLFAEHDVYCQRRTGTGQTISTSLVDVQFPSTSPQSLDFIILGIPPYTMQYINEPCVMYMTATACVSRTVGDATLFLGIYVNDVLQTGSVGHVKQVGDIDVITVCCIANVPQNATIKVKAVASGNLDIAPMTVGTETSTGCVLNLFKISQ